MPAPAPESHRPGRPPRISGGQYSLLRGITGLLAAAGFLVLLCASAPDPLTTGWRLLAPAEQPDWVLDPVGADGSLLVARGAQVLGLVLGLLLAVGWRARITSLLLAGLWGTFQGFWLPGGTPSTLALFSWVLALQALVPGAPYGSLAARGRTDPRGPWSFPTALHLALGLLYAAHCVAVALGLGLWEWGAGTHPLQAMLGYPLLAVPVLLVPTRTRALAWSLGGGLLGLALFLQDQPMLFWLPLQLALFDARWIPQTSGNGRETLFYDGNCALCHGTVRFFLAEDQRPRPVRFATLQGAHCSDVIDARIRTSLPDSVVLREADGSLHLRSEAVLRLLGRLGGLWWIVATLLRLAPRALRDLVYDVVSATRYRVFGRQDRACPILPPALRERFLD